MPHNPGPLLTGDRLGGEQPIPPEFIAAMERHVDVQWNPTTKEPEPLSDTVVESDIVTDRINERKKTTVSKKAGNITLSGIRHNDNGQPVQVTLTMRPTTDAAAQPSATQQVAVKDLGNGWSIEEKSVEGSYVNGSFVAGIFPGNLYGKERPNLVPEKFRPSIPIVTTRVDAAGSAAAPTLSGTELREVQEQVDLFKFRTTIDTQADPSVPVSLTGYETTREQQLATVVETLETAGTAAATPTSTMDVQVQNLGNGFQVQRTSTVSAIFPQTASGHKQMVVVPEKFRPASMTLTTTGATSTGTTATPTALGTGGTGVVESTAQRVDATKVRVESTTLTGTPDTSVQEYGYVEGLVAPITTTFIADSAGASSGGLLVTDVRREVIGGGKAINKLETVASWPTRYGQDYNARFDVIVPWSESTIAPVASGTARTEIRPVDYARQRNRTYDYTALEAAYAASVVQFPGKTVVDLPDVLESITVTYNKSTGSGASNHPVTQQWFQIVNGGSAGLSPKAQAQGSAAILADVTWEIARYGGISVDCQHYYFYLTSAATLAAVLAKLATLGAGAVQSLPVFRPRSHQIKVYGGQISVQATADTQASAGWSQNNAGVITSYARQWEYGDGYSKEVGVSTRVLTIPPTIHGAISVSGLLTDTEMVTVTVKANTVSQGPIVSVPAITNEPTPVTATVTAGVTPTSFPATSPGVIPTSGKYLVAATGDPVDFGYTLIHAVVVDFAQYA